MHNCSASQTTSSVRENSSVYDFDPASTEWLVVHSKKIVEKATIVLRYIIRLHSEKVPRKFTVGVRVSGRVRI